VNLGYLEALPRFADVIYGLRIVEYAPVFLWIVGYSWWVHSESSRTVGRSAADVTS
jgi:hypothetical protein